MYLLKVKIGKWMTLQQFLENKKEIELAYIYFLLFDKGWNHVKFFSSIVQLDE